MDTTSGLRDQATDICQSAAEVRQQAYDAALILGNCAIAFAQIERAPRYGGRRENDAEHSFMLALVAPELASSLCPDLSIGLVSEYSILHDLIELETGDIATFTLSSEELAEKKANEQTRLDQLLRRLPPRTASLIQRYERQEEREARFVRMVDKILPLIVNASGSGKRVMREDFAITNKQELDNAERQCALQLRGVFPEAELAPLHVVRDMLAKHFSEIYHEGAGEL